MRRRLRLPQFAAVMGPCIAGGAYLPALSDLIVMVEGTSFMGLGGANLVKGATGPGGGRRRARWRARAHQRERRGSPARARRPCVLDLAARTPRRSARAGGHATRRAARPPAEALLDLLPADHRMPYDIEVVLECVFDAGAEWSFQPDFAPELYVPYARLDGRPGGS
jgi:acetyl-CoA carboxylase carboxyltransferase component